MENKNRKIPQAECELVENVYFYSFYFSEKAHTSTLRWNANKSIWYVVRWCWRWFIQLGKQMIGICEFPIISYLYIHWLNQLWEQQRKQKRVSIKINKNKYNIVFAVIKKKENWKKRGSKIVVIFGIPNEWVNRRDALTTHSPWPQTEFDINFFFYLKTKQEQSVETMRYLLCGGSAILNQLRLCVREPVNIWTSVFFSLSIYIANANSVERLTYTKWIRFQNSVHSSFCLSD